VADPPWRESTNEYDDPTATPTASCSDRTVKVRFIVLKTRFATPCTMADEHFVTSGFAEEIAPDLETRLDTL
jgi:hypothetical protein